MSGYQRVWYDTSMAHTWFIDDSPTKIMIFHSYLQLAEAISYHHMSHFSTAAVSHLQVKNRVLSCSFYQVGTSLIFYHGNEMMIPNDIHIFRLAWNLKTRKQKSIQAQFYHPYVGIRDIFTSIVCGVRHWRTSLGPWQRWISLMSHCSRRTELSEKIIKPLGQP